MIDRESNGWQVRTAGGGVLADDGTWHQFTVAAESAAVAGPGRPDAPVWPARVAREPRASGVAAVAVVLAGVALFARRGGFRRRRTVVAGVVLGVRVPAAALAQTTTQVIEYYTTDAIGSVRAVTKQVNGQWQVVARHDFMAASARQPSTASYGEPRRSNPRRTDRAGGLRRRAGSGGSRAAHPAAGQAAVHGQGTGQRNGDGLLRGEVLQGVGREVLHD